jgi:iron(III) transport system ATP-binding protein
MNNSIATALTNPGAPMKVRGVQKRFGAFTALDNVSLDVAAGELVCLLGPSGCGKTTLLRCIAGLEKQDSGELYLGDRDVSHLAPQARDYGILFQSYALFPNLTVEANIAYGLAGSGRDQVRQRVGQMLELVGLSGSEKKYPGQLSGGQQQRVALARALAPAPSLLLLDEPMSALDARVREHLCTELRQLQRSLGITTLMVTHTQVGGINMRLADGGAKTASGRLFCRPEAINVNPLVHEENLFPAKVREITFLGNRCRMSFELDQLPGHALLAELAPEAMPRLGAQQIMVALPPRSLQVFA